MSRIHLDAHVEVSSFPRVSGDEPDALGVEVVESLFSPRERG